MTILSLNKESFRFPVTELLLLLVAIFWGTSYGLTKEAVVYTSVLIFIAIRFLMTFLCLLPLLIRDFSRGLNRDWRVAIPTGCVLAGIFFCEVFGVSQTSASNAAFLISLSVILTVFLETLINKNRVSPTLVVLVVCSVFGVYLLTGSSAFELSLNKGDYYILAAAALRALMVTLTKRFSDGRQITTATLTAIQSLVVALISLAAAVVFLPLEAFVLPTAATFWLTMGYLVLFCTLFAFYVQNFSVRKTSPTRVALLMGSEPLFGALFAVMWLQESLTWLQVMGGGVILFCVIITSLQKT